MLSKAELESLVHDQDRDQGHNELEGDIRVRKQPRQITSILYHFFFGISVLLNIGFLVYLPRACNITATSTAPHKYLSTRVSPYSGLAYDTPVKYVLNSDYTSSNHTMADEMWSKVDNVLAIAVTDDWIREKGLPPSWRFPWDLDKWIYFPKVGHQLHCLKSMRAAYHELWQHNHTRFTRGHLEHCLNTLRQDLMCQADDTPMPSLKPVSAVGDQQTMQCKNFDKLREWIYAPERNACYHHINMYNGVRHPIERYAFCPEDSENYPVMQQYFHVHGHKSTIEDWG